MSFWILTQYVSVLLTAICFIGLGVTASDFGWVVAFLFWLFIPANIITCISFFWSLNCRTKHKKILLVLNIINILLVLFWWFNPANKCDAEIMEQHYIKYGDRMKQIYEELNNKLNSDCSVSIEFENGNVSMFHFKDGIEELESNWDPSEEKIDSLLCESGLDRCSLKRLEQNLEEIGCISISVQPDSVGSYSIGFRRIGMGMYYYQIYNKPLSIEEQEEIRESDASILYSPTVAFKYAGGAIGNQVFIGKEDYLKKKYN